MDFTNMTCPACQRAFTKDDDVVVCPDCGTPQHRECWQNAGGCFNKARHGTGFVWALPETETPGITKKESPPVICPKCGAANDPNADFCSRCGSMLEKQETGEPRSFFSRFDSGNEDDGRDDRRYGYDNPNNSSAYQNPVYRAAQERYGGRTIDGIPAEDVALYVKKNDAYYTDGFMRFQENETKTRWNWAAFLFPVFWSFYRKMMVIGMAALISLFCASTLASELTPRVFRAAAPDIYSAYEAAEEDLFGYLQTIAETRDYSAVSAEGYIEAARSYLFSPVTMASGIVRLALWLIISLTWGFFGTYWYKRRTVNIIRSIRQNVPDAGMYMMYLARTGGVSVLNVILPVALYILLSSVSSFF